MSATGPPSSAAAAAASAAVRTTPARGQRQPVAAGEIDDVLRVEPVHARRQRAGDDRRGLVARRGRLDHRGRGRRERAHLAVARGGGERPRRVLRERVDGDRRVAQRDRRLAGAQEHRRDRQPAPGRGEAGDDRARRGLGAEHERRHVDDRQRIDRRVVRGGGDRGAQPVRRRVPEHVEGVRRRVAERRQLEPGRLGGVREQDRRPAAVGDDAEPASGGRRTAGEQRGDVEQLAVALGADHAGLGEQRVHGRVGGRHERARVRSGRAPARRRAPGLDGHDRLGAADAARDPGEPARVAERLEVQRDHRRWRRRLRTTGSRRCSTRRRGRRSRRRRRGRRRDPAPARAPRWRCRRSARRARRTRAGAATGRRWRSGAARRRPGSWGR